MYFDTNNDRNKWNTKNIYMDAFSQEIVIQTMPVRNAPLPKTRKLARKHNAIVMSGIIR